ncbi:MAG: hypothetical protein IJC27_08595 [Lentisphaeria bacterium]|nr:hypothetical protein [Lentisphaeria bacterium]
MIKRLLFFCLTLLFFISVPYEVSAAPQKETRKERRERKKKRKNDKVQRPVKQKITPTLEENLSPAQVTKKIQTIRRRVETAPENVFPDTDKRVFLEVFDDMIQTEMGRYIFEKAHPDLSFRVKQMERTTNGSYGYRSRCINLASGIFEQIRNAKTPDEKLSKQLYLAHVIAHEATHSIQHVNNLNDKSNMSFEEMITINKLFELHAILNENIVRYQIGNLPKYRHMLPDSHKRTREAIPGKVNLVPMHLFYRELKEKKMASGADEKTAERFTRTKFVESFWQNNGKTPIQVGNQTVMPTTSNVSEVFDTWNGTYNILGFKRLLNDKRSYHQQMKDVGITKKIQRFIDVMEIDTPTSFFRDPKTTAFKMLSSKRFISYLDGIKDLEMDVLTTGYVKKVYRDGCLSSVTFYTTQPKEAQENGPRTEYHEGTRIKRATYTYQGGKMNGVYREYDRQGRQTAEIPVVEGIPQGKGWIMENNVRAYKKFERWYDQTSQARRVRE